jgi:hypothetical protein
MRHAKTYYYIDWNLSEKDNFEVHQPEQKCEVKADDHLFPILNNVMPLKRLPGHNACDAQIYPNSILKQE